MRNMIGKKIKELRLQNNYNQEEIKNILQETYQLPLLNLTHQGKQLFVPQLK